MALIYFGLTLVASSPAVLPTGIPRSYRRSIRLSTAAVLCCWPTGCLIGWCDTCFHGGCHGFGVFVWFSMCYLSMLLHVRGTAGFAAAAGGNELPAGASPEVVALVSAIRAQLTFGVRFKLAVCGTQTFALLMLLFGSAAMYLSCDEIPDLDVAQCVDPSLADKSYEYCTNSEWGVNTGGNSTCLYNMRGCKPPDRVRVCGQHLFVLSVWLYGVAIAIDFVRLFGPAAKLVRLCGRGPLQAVDTEDDQSAKTGTETTAAPIEAVETGGDRSTKAGTETAAAPIEAVETESDRSAKAGTKNAVDPIGIIEFNTVSHV